MLPILIFMSHAGFLFPPSPPCFDLAAFNSMFSWFTFLREAALRIVACSHWILFYKMLPVGVYYQVLLHCILFPMHYFHYGRIHQLVDSLFLWRLVMLSIPTLDLNPNSTPCFMVMEEQANARSVLRDSEIKQEKIGSLFKSYKFHMCSTMSCQGKLVSSSPTQ